MTKAFDLLDFIIDSILGPLSAIKDVFVIVGEGIVYLSNIITYFPSYLSDFALLIISVAVVLHFFNRG